MAATIAHSGAPPCVGPSTAGSRQRFVVLHDCAFTFRSNKGYHNADFGTHLTKAIEHFRFGEAAVRVQMCEYNAPLRDTVEIAEKIKSETDVPV